MSVNFESKKGEVQVLDPDKCWRWWCVLSMSVFVFFVFIYVPSSIYSHFRILFIKCLKKVTEIFFPVTNCYWANLSMTDNPPVVGWNVFLLIFKFCFADHTDCNVCNPIDSDVMVYGWF